MKLKIAVISSTSYDLPEHRMEVMKACQRAKLEPKWMEILAAGGTPLEASIKLVDEADVYIGIFAHRYGSCATGSEISYTEAEFRRAEERGILILPYFIDENQPVLPAQMDLGQAGEKLRALKAEIGSRHVAATFTTPADLGGKVFQALLEHFPPIVPESEEVFPVTDMAGKTLTAVSPEVAIEQYQQHVTERCADIRPMGFGVAINVFRLPIRDAYVHLETSYSGFGAREEDEDHLTGRESDRSLPFTDLFTLVHQKRECRAALAFGVAGAGKTTGAKKVAWALASGELSAASLGLPEGTLALWLPFREMDEDAVQVDPEGRSPLEAFLVQQSSFKPIGIEGELIQAGGALLSANQPLLWILDGLDELPTEALRLQVCQWLVDLHERRRQDLFLVTSRYFGDQAAEKSLMPHFQRFDVVALRDELQRAFVQNYFRLRNRYEAQGLSDTEVDQKAEHFYTELKKLELAPDADSKLPELAGNPLMLSIMCFVYDGKQGVLPKRRSELYKYCVEVLVVHWREKVKRSTDQEDFSSDRALEVLNALAWWLQDSSDRTSAPRQELEAETQRLLDAYLVKAGLPQEAESFLTLMLEHCGIMAVTGGAGRLGFLHLRLQEYLAALHVQKLVNGPAELAQRFVATHNEDRWREVIGLSIRMGNRHFCEELFGGLLGAEVDRLGEDEASFLGRCVADAETGLMAPFIRVFEDPAIAPERKARLLRMFLVFEADQLRPLVPVAKALMETPAVQTVALELLRKAGEPLPEIKTPALRETLEDTWTDPRTGISYVRIEPGEFLMGEGGSARKVVIEEGFYLAQYPVTNQQFRKFLQDAKPGNVEQPEYWNEARFNGDQQPVVGISWDDAVAFCEWAGGGLPSAAQWEYACRAGTTTRFSFGDDEALLNEYGWYEANSGSKTHDVGLLKPNPWGLYDMHGNVWEWCQDTEGGSIRVFRGGSWRNPAEGCRSAFRIRYDPSIRGITLGFRPQVPISQAAETAEPGPAGETGSGAPEAGKGLGNRSAQRRRWTWPWKAGGA